jgi:uncharacterized delta-60 repeat protein
MGLRPRSSLPGWVALSLVLILESAAFAAPGDLDTTFSSDGKVTTDFTPGFDEGIAIAIQGDGKIVAGGAVPSSGGSFALARYETDGDLDTTFGGDGRVTTNFTSGPEYIDALVIQTDGKVVAVGRGGGAGGRFALARYQTDGDLDTTFGGDGRVTTDFTSGFDYAEDVALQPDGRLVVVGLAGGAGGRFALARYETDGDLDTTFDGDGKVTTDFKSGEDDATGVALQADGKIVAAGWAGPARSNDYVFAVARYLTGGGLDSSFGGDGKVTTNFTSGNDYAWDMALQSDGKVVAVGAAAGAGERFALARYNTDGGPDSTFGGDGKVVTNLKSGSDVATGVGIQADGKVVAAGWTGPSGSLDYRFAVARYDTNGVPDSTFSGDGVASTDFTGGNDYAWDMALQADGKIVAVGRAGGAGGRFALARYEG